MSKEWKPEIDKAIEDVCINIIQEPLTYFSEADIQQLLVERLRQIPCIGTSKGTAVFKGKGSKGRYSTPLLHREYGGGNGTRIDIVILDPSDVGEINSPNLKKGNEYLCPLYSFELGTEKTSDTSTHFQNDLDKLSRRTKRTGYLIHIYKDVTQAAKGTKLRENTEEKIKQKFKDVFKEASQQNDKIKILAILVRTYRNQHKMRGKCEIFDAFQNEWIKTNVSRLPELRKAIHNQLGSMR